MIYDVGFRGNHVISPYTYKQGFLSVRASFTMSKMSDILYTSSIPPPRITSPALPGVPASLLERIVRCVVVLRLHPLSSELVMRIVGPLVVVFQLPFALIKCTSVAKVPSATQPALKPILTDLSISGSCFFDAPPLPSLAIRFPTKSN